MEWTSQRVAEVVAGACPAGAYKAKRVLLIVPDGTRTAPVNVLFKAIHDELGEVTSALDVLVALGTHQPMSHAAICARLGISETEHRERYRRVNFFNHAWDDPGALVQVGSLEPAQVRELTGGLFEMQVPVKINKLLYDYDQVVIIGPVFPHEVVGFSGGNKYLFPGVGGPEILNFFHWLGAVVTNPMIIGNKWTPVRKVVDQAARLVTVPKLCFAMVVDGKNSLLGLFAGTPESAWDKASDLSSAHHIARKQQAFRTILSQAPAMYDELWTAGKCMYKLEPVLADDGELIIYAPHLKEICVSHGRHILEIGYHCRDFFLQQWEKYKRYPWGVLAHSTHVRGLGTFSNGVERCRAQVTLATQIPEEVCRSINLGYRNPATIDPRQYANREAEGVLYVPKAGEMLYKLERPPRWAGGES